MTYMLPRLRGWGESLSRQAGGRAAGGAGIGGRGPGETKIETDRRRIRDRMAKLRKEIIEMKKSRDTMRQERVKYQVPSVAIAGYTNAGKSSLLNRFTGAGVLVENALFATLDPTVRKTESSDGETYTFVDTVGFVRHLPHQLIEAFKSTLFGACKHGRLWINLCVAWGELLSSDHNLWRKYPVVSTTYRGKSRPRFQE